MSHLKAYMRYKREIPNWKEVFRTNTSVFFDAHGPKFCIQGCKVLDLDSKVAVMEHLRDIYPHHRE